MEKITGRLVSGVGDFSKWIEKLRDHYEDKTGLKLFPGTLNLELDAPFRLPAERIRLEGDEYGGTVSVNIVPCKVFGRKAVILRTDANEAGTGHHPLTIVEIATDGPIAELEHRLSEPGFTFRHERLRRRGGLQALRGRLSPYDRALRHFRSLYFGLVPGLAWSREGDGAE